MPNHCDHDMWIEGPVDVVNHIIAAHLDGHGAIEASSLIPYPKEFEDKDKIYDEWRKANSDEQGKLKPNIKWSSAPKNGFNSGGYEWCISNWGSKWGCYDGRGIQEIKLKNNRRKKIQIQFFTAWAPAEPLYRKLAEMYPLCKIEVHYFEMGMGFAGQLVYENGVLIASTEDSNYRGERGG